MASLGFIIKKACEEKKISLTQLEQSAGISKNYIHVIMKNNDCQFSTLKNIAHALNVDISVFFDKGLKKEEEMDCKTELLQAYRTISKLHFELDRIKTFTREKHVKK